MKLLTLGFSLAQPQLLQDLGIEPAICGLNWWVEDISLPLQFCLSTKYNKFLECVIRGSACVYIGVGL